MLLLIKQKNIKFFFGYNSQEELKEYIENFFQDFIAKFFYSCNFVAIDISAKIDNFHYGR